MGVSISTQGLDSYVRSDYPAESFAHPPVLRVRSGGPTILSYLWRVPPDLPRGATVLSAKLVLTQQYDQTAARNLVVHRIAEKVDVQRVTWNTVPQVVGHDSRAISKTASLRYTEWELDVTDHLQAIADGEPWYGWRLSTSQAAELAFFSYEAPAAVRPRLEVEWSDAPHPPSALTPGTGQVVAVPKPVLRSTFSDVAGDVTLSAVQVQINATNSWAAPAWDSGIVQTRQPELDLNATNYPGIPSGAAPWWRMRHRDGAGHWSDWSDAVQPQYVPPVTLTVTGPPALTESSSPTAQWTVTGGVQTAWRVLVYRMPGLQLVWDSGHRSGAAMAAAITAAALSWDDQDYRVEVRVWDNLDRVATPGVPVWRSATRDFHLDRDGSQTPVTDLAAVVADADRVAVRLTWARATRPEGWVITRDGQTVARLDATGAAGEFFDYGAAPRTMHAYGVSAIVNGRVGPQQHILTDEKLLVPAGAWLVDPVDGQRVVVFKEGISEWSLAEDTTVHAPLGAPGVVPITRSLGGARGTVAGELASTHNTRPRFATKRSAQEWLDAWLDLRGRTGAALRLITADRNIPVVAWGMTERPVAYGPHIRSVVEAHWAQAAEYAGGPR